MHAIAKLCKEAFSGIPRDLWLLALGALINRSGTMVLPFLTLYLTAERGVSAAEAGQLVAVYGVGAMFGAYLGGWLSDHIGSIRAQQLSLVTGGVGFLILSAVRERWAIAITLFFVSIVVEASAPRSWRRLRRTRPKRAARRRLPFFGSLSISASVYR